MSFIAFSLEELLGLTTSGKSSYSVCSIEAISTQRALLVEDSAAKSSLAHKFTVILDVCGNDKIHLYDEIHAAGTAVIHFSDCLYSWNILTRYGLNVMSSLILISDQITSINEFCRAKY